MNQRAMMKYVIGAVAVLLVALLPSGASAFEEPTGFGKARFGTTPEELLKQYPSASLVARPSPAAGAGSFNLVSYRLEEQRVGPLEKCRIEFRFSGARLELYEIQFACPQKEEVSRYLTATFGMPSKTTESTLIWQGSRVAISHVPKGGVFSYGDIERSKAMQASLIKALGNLKVGAKPPIPAAP
jgi:hypothetical protein